MSVSAKRQWVYWAASILVVATAGAVLVLRGGTSPAQAAWGEAKDGLRTRLVANRATWTVGERVIIRLEVRNDSTQTLSYDEPQQVICEEGLMVRRDGKPVRYIAGAFQTAGTSRHIRPGETQSLGDIFVAEFWDLRAPGRYTVQFPETSLHMPEGLAESREDGKGSRPALPASNVLELEVKLPLDGRVPPLDLRSRAQVHLGRNPWPLSEFRCLALNYEADMPPTGGDWFAGAFATTLPDEPRSVYEDRLVLLAVQMPFCRADDRFGVAYASLKGSTIRLSIKATWAKGGESRLPYLAVHLDRLLAPGTYACQVQFQGDGAEAARTQTRDFAFTVSPKRGG